jgi:hypothetical protein
MIQDEKFFEVLKQINRTPIEQATLSHSAIISIDRKLVQAVAERYGEDKAIEVHKKKWLYIIEREFEDLQKRFKLKRGNELQILGRIMQNVYDNTFLCPFKYSIVTPRKAVGIIIACPFYDAGRSIYGDKHGSVWFNAIANTCIWIAGKITNLAGLSGIITVERDKCMCLNKNDDICRIILQYKRC